MRMNYISLSIAALFAFTLAACAPAQKEHMEGNMKMDMGGEEEVAFGEPAMASMATRTITVTIVDTEYDLKDLKVKDGEVIRFIIVNKDETEHEFTLGTKEMNAADRMKMEKQMDNDESMEMHEPNAVSLGDLETKELVWKFKGPGKIEFACNVPGHYEAGMMGNITIMN